MQIRNVIAIVNEKGGTAKTSTAVNLSAALGELNQKVLLVDLDGQAASSRWLGVKDDHRLAEALVRGNGLDPIRNVVPGICLAPGSGKLDSVAHDLRPTQGGQLRKVLSEMTEFDYIFIDCPPSMGNRLIGNALLAATHVIIPVETSILALDGLKMLLTTLEDIRDGMGHDIILGGVLACRFDGRTRLSHLVKKELTRALGDRVFRTVIRENVRMRECPASGQSILTFASDSHAAEDYRALAKEILDNPARWDQSSGQSQETKPQRFAVDDLSSQAAEMVRESARKMFSHRTSNAPRWRKEEEEQPETLPLEPKSDTGSETPEQTEEFPANDGIDRGGHQAGEVEHESGTDSFTDLVERLSEADRNLEGQDDGESRQTDDGIVVVIEPQPNSDEPLTLPTPAPDITHQATEQSQTSNAVSHPGEAVPYTDGSSPCLHDTEDPQSTDVTQESDPGEPEQLSGENGPEEDIQEIDQFPALHALLRDITEQGQAKE